MGEGRVAKRGRFSKNQMFSTRQPVFAVAYLVYSPPTCSPNGPKTLWPSLFTHGCFCRAVLREIGAVEKRGRVQPEGLRSLFVSVGFRATSELSAWVHGIMTTEHMRFFNGYSACVYRGCKRVPVCKASWLVAFSLSFSLLSSGRTVAALLATLKKCNDQPLTRGALLLYIALQQQHYLRCDSAHVWFVGGAIFLFLFLFSVPRNREAMPMNMHETYSRTLSTAVICVFPCDPVWFPCRDVNR